MKKNAKLLIGLGIAATAVAAFTAGVVHELKVIKKLTTDIDDLPEEEVPAEECEDEIEEIAE